MMRNQMMSLVWLMNALENALHEPNCLMTELLEKGAIKSMAPTDLAMEEQAYAMHELQTLIDRLALSHELLERLEAAAGQAQNKWETATAAISGT